MRGQPADTASKIRLTQQWLWVFGTSHSEEKEKEAYPSPCLVVAGDYDLFLLHGQRESFEGRGLVLEDACVEAVLGVGESASAVRFEEAVYHVSRLLCRVLRSGA